VSLKITLDNSVLVVNHECPFQVEFSENGFAIKVEVVGSLPSVSPLLLVHLVLGCDHSLCSLLEVLFVWINFLQNTQHIIQHTVRVGIKRAKWGKPLKHLGNTFPYDQAPAHVVISQLDLVEVRHHARP
jgi:hypothetical protein